MSVSSEISRLQGAKATLKTKLNAINKSTDQIADETIDEYGDFVDTISNNISAAVNVLNTSLIEYPEDNKMIAVGKGVNVRLDDTEEESLDDFKILGRTVQNGTPSPSNPVAIENVCGKNIFDESQFLQATGWTKNSSGYYTGTAQNLYTKFKDGATDFNFPISFKPNTQYTISFTAYYQGSNNIGGRFSITYTDGTYSTSAWIESTTAVYLSRTTTSGKTIKKINFNYGNGGTMYIKDMQIEEGTTATSFMQYNTVKIKRTDGTSEETYSFPLGDSSLMAGDYIDKLGIHHVKEQVVFDGSSDENWQLWNYSGANVQRFYITSTARKGNSFYLCDRFTVVSGSSDTEHTYLGGTNFNESIFFIDRTKASTVANFKTWLSNNPVTIEYGLATPTVTPLTSEQQTVYNEILQDGTYEVVTIYTGEGNLAPDMEINYHKDLQPRLSQTIADVADILG